MKRKAVYPFTAIVGQDNMKLSLILNVINPALGGVLIKGEKGTAKSTAVRALAELLPAMDAVEGCPFHCDPLEPNLLCEACSAKYKKGMQLAKTAINMKVVELPVSATEDRVVGTLDIEQAIKHVKALLPHVGDLYYFTNFNLGICFRKSFFRNFAWRYIHRNYFTYCLWFGGASLYRWLVFSVIDPKLWSFCCFGSCCRYGYANP